MGPKQYKMSEQFMTVLMAVVVKCLAEQTDIVPLLNDLDIYVDDDEQLSVSNPPEKIEPNWGDGSLEDN